MALPAIGYVTSGKYAGSLKTHFLAGLAPTWQGDPNLPNPNVTIKTGEADGDYDAKGTRQTLNRHVVRLSNDPDVKLIVAVGGLVSAFAAAKHSTKPFLVVIGQLPSVDDFDLDPDDVFNYCGGINLNTTAVNAERNRQIAAAAGCSGPDVCLIANNNARMAKSERRAWKAHGWPSVNGGADADGDNDADDFKEAFKRAKKKKNAKAIVISSDPFFAHKRNDLVLAANTQSLPVCYPTKYFGGANPVPTTGRDIWVGPDLDDVYRRLGVKTGALLTQIINTGSASFVGLDPAAIGNGPF
jgi:hypothetical protein